MMECRRKGPDPFQVPVVQQLELLKVTHFKDIVVDGLTNRSETMSNTTDIQGMLYRTLGFPVLAAAKYLGRRCQHLLLPEADLVGVNAELLGELVYRPLALDCFQGDLGLELLGELPATHETPFSDSRIPF